jgi:hypothetical protein
VQRAESHDSRGKVQTGGRQHHRADHEADREIQEGGSDAPNAQAGQVNAP